MKKIGKIMEELGFNKDAPDSVKESFIKHLAFVNTDQKVAATLEKNKADLLKYKYEPEAQQLSFFDQDKKKVI